MPVSPSNETSAQETAAHWVARMDGDRWTDADEAALNDWLESDPDHAGILLRTQAMWMSAGFALKPERSARRPDRARIRWRGAFAMAASVAASLPVGMAMIDTPQHYATRVGEIRRLPLEDGSVATINSSSDVAIDIAKGRREVKIARGEAWFQVARDPKRPFIVEAGRIRVQAIGTAFSVRRTDLGAEVFVTQGVVEAWVKEAGDKHVRLVAGTRSLLREGIGIQEQVVLPWSVERPPAWSGGKIELLGERLSDVVDQFNRFNQRKLVILDPVLADERFDGTFRLDDPASFALAVKASLGVSIDVSDPDTIRLGHP